MRLLQTLNAIKSKNLISFFMPGHKMGRHIKASFELGYDYDITEIPGADYLHDPTGTILVSEQSIAAFYKAGVSKMLINGSTVGILSMMLGVCGDGAVILNRNAHKSVYHAIEMGRMTPLYLVPKLDDDLAIPLSVSPDQLKQLLIAHPEAKACVLTYPTYEGLCYDLGALIEICHEHNVAVLVDEAHGAHLRLNERLPKSALDLGADIVIQSFHKTLPSLTQTACLHISKKTILTTHQMDKVIWYLKVLQTSSPSYLLMGSIDAMMQLIEDKGEEMMSTLLEQIVAFETRIQVLTPFKCVRYEGMDLTKLMIAPSAEIRNCGYDGEWLSQTLNKRFAIQVEYATPTLCLLMPSISTSRSDFDALAKALETLACELDKENERAPLSPDEGCSPLEQVAAYAFEPKQVMLPCELDSTQGMYIELDAAMGMISKKYVIPYPPGIPILVPGEMITQEVLDAVYHYRHQLLTIDERGIEVVDPEYNVALAPK